MRTLLLIALFCTCGPAQVKAQTDAKAKALIDLMVEAVGGVNGMHELKDVSFTYGNYRGVSEERYIFDGEISWGKSETQEGETQIQFYDGDEARVWIDGKETTDKKALESAFFSRKTNYFWLAMMQKMKDPGLVYTYAGTRSFEGIDYELVDVTFEDGVGVAKDRYLLYVNPYTHLVDQFLFNVTAVGRQDPIMMKYTYDTFAGGVKFPVVGQSRAAANWEGDLDPQAKWSSRYRADFKFNNGYSKESIRIE
ncbi:DUF6503 family protein [Neolewinella persica]|uniref:DUF6503 family protein n=1 Tax=Neolewinella persica TaxID=70998 RepID=UPI000364F90F|nr:DUF6503 family protein [Neolewinella persica]